MVTKHSLIGNCKQVHLLERSKRVAALIDFPVATALIDEISSFSNKSYELKHTKNGNSIQVDWTLTILQKEESLLLNNDAGSDSERIQPLHPLETLCKVTRWNWANFNWVSDLGEYRKFSLKMFHQPINAKFNAAVRWEVMPISRQSRQVKRIVCIILIHQQFYSI